MVGTIFIEQSSEIKGLGKESGFTTPPSRTVWVKLVGMARLASGHVELEIFFQKGFLTMQIQKQILFMKRGRLLRKQKAPARNTAGTGTQFGSIKSFSKKARIQLSKSY